MGWGDELMVTAQARRLQARDARPVVVLDGAGRARWHPIWENNPRLVRPSSAYSPRRVQTLYNFPGQRPYLDYARFLNRDKREPYVYTDFRVEPGEIYLSEVEQRLGARLRSRGAVVLEPHIKPNASPNKDWGWGRWQALAHELRGLDLVQLGAPGVRVLEGVEFVPTLTVREAAAMLREVELLIAPEGGLHHAAAALGVRAVVIFGGFISPRTTGYESHVNFFSGGRACGMRLPCAHCQEAMARIAPEEVAAAARQVLADREIVA